MGGVTVQANANYANGQDVLAFTNTPNITGNFDASAATLTLTRTESVANYQNALRSITYENTSATPTAEVRRLAITVDGATNPSFSVNGYLSVG